MKRLLLPVIFLLIVKSILAQVATEDWNWWNELHGWEIGDPGWRNWIIMAPGYMGPNALPVPEVKKGIVSPKSEIALTASNHFNAKDPTQDISAKLYLPFAKNKIAVEFYGVILEHYSFTEEIRNRRFARDRDGKGYAAGDLYFSTLIQVTKDRKFPNTLLRIATKTTSGSRLEAARFTDTPANFFDISFSRSIKHKTNNVLRPFGSVGFFVWQTNDEANLQNDALMYSAGTDFVKNNWLFSASLSGYSGYKKYDKPIQLNLDFRKELDEKTAIRIQYLHGFRDWNYKTLRFSYIWTFNPVE